LRFLITYLLFFGVLFLNAQNESNIWYFGGFAGLNFNPGDPVVDTNNNVMSSYGGTSVMCDNNGNLLFFTNGETIWNREFKVMKNGDSLAGNPDATQACIIIPHPGDKDQYMVFTLDKAPPEGFNGLHYSVVDIKEDNSRGEVVTKNIPLIAPASEQITATLHANRSDVWVIVHGWDNDEFYTYLVDENGVDDDPVVSKIGSIHTATAEGTPVGALKASPDGNFIASALYYKMVFEFFSFDNTTGKLSDFVASKPLYRGAYGVEFSPDSRKVYGSTYFLNDK